MDSALAGLINGIKNSINALFNPFDYKILKVAGQFDVVTSSYEEVVNISGKGELYTAQISDDVNGNAGLKITVDGSVIFEQIVSDGEIGLVYGGTSGAESTAGYVPVVNRSNGAGGAHSFGPSSFDPDSVNTGFIVLDVPITFKNSLVIEVLNDQSIYVGVNISGRYIA